LPPYPLGVVEEYIIFIALFFISQRLFGGAFLFDEVDMKYSTMMTFRFSFEENKSNT